VSGGYNSSNVYNSGITNNGTQNGIITFTVQDDAPNTLYYACEFHSSMQGLITITGDIDDDDEFLGIDENENSDGIPVSGLNLIKEFEGCRLTAYNDPLTGGKPITVGWGSTKNTDGSDFVLYEKISQTKADNLLLYQCKKEYLPSISKIPYWNEMNDGQKGALLSFAYNLGAGFYGKYKTITSVLKNKEWDKVPATLYMYRNPNTNVEAGLAKRRTAEGVAWTKGIYP
jgi:lysozyme